MSLPLANGVNDNAEAAHLLSSNNEDMELSDMTQNRNGSKGEATRVDTRYTDQSENEGPSNSTADRQELEDDVARINPGVSSHEYRVYGIRWFGLIQLVLLNIIVSWDVSQALGGKAGHLLHLSLADYSEKVSFSGWVVAALTACKMIRRWRISR